MGSTTGRSGDTSPVIPRPGSFDPAVIQVRLVGPPAAVDAAVALFADLCGKAWQPATRKRSRHDGGDELQYGTLIVPVPR